MTTRLILALVAVAVAGWFALALRSANDVDNGVVLVARGGPGGARTEPPEARASFDRGRRFNADAGVLVKESSALLLAQYPPRTAVDALRHAVDLEPENSEAWFLLSVALAQAGDREEAAGARRRARELDPGIPR